VRREDLLDRVQRAGADVAVDDADGAERQSRQPLAPTRAWLFGRSAGGRFEGFIDGGDALCKDRQRARKRIRNA
jgi:hypothetical protein